ncbi:Fc.00g051770.m01.CDS01 [Cosmosporella sp. VM-42]
MPESLDIQNLLQTGYFTTSRAKSPPKPSSSRIDNPPYSRPGPSHAPAGPRPIETASRPRRNGPPPPRPTVEDEATSLKREHGPTITTTSEDEPPSRGDIDQNPLIMEVHEYNPERRFVIIKGKNAEKPVPEKAPETKRPEARAPETRVPETRVPETRPPRERRQSDDRTYEANSRRKDESNLKPDSGYGTDGGRPRLEKRRSRQDLPRIETELKPDRVPEHHRAHSHGHTSRPEQTPDRQPRPYVEQTLSPEVIKHGSSGREKAYHGYGQPQSTRPPAPVHRAQPNDRRFEEGTVRGSSTPSTSKRSDAKVDPVKPIRPVSNDRTNERMNDSRYRGEPVAPRSSKQEKPPPYGRSDREENPPSSKYPAQDLAGRRDDTRRDGSRSSDEQSKGTRDTNKPGRKSIVVQEGRESLPKLGNDDELGVGRLRTRGPTMPLPIPALSGFPDDLPIRNASTFPVTKDAQRPTERPKAQLPYPVDDEPLVDPLADPFETRGNSQYDTLPPVSMPELPYPIAIGPETPLEARISAVPPIPSTQPWQPPAFDPERDGVRLDKLVGTYRRYSEHADAVGVPKFPECRRKHPVKGMVDWLTLPRTDFNICPECYGGVFGDTEYRHHFQILLRPSDKAIACDFGLYPWYRIAFLLTLKNDKPDLRLFHQVATVMAATKNSPCPGSTATLRSWLTIRNPYTRRPIYDFAVCHQCAGVVEALLPNLDGLFIPLGSRSEPTKRTCSMHFTPKRKRFVMYFDAMETTSDRALLEKEAPDTQNLADELEKMTVISECREDKPISNGYWHIMQYLRQFSVCGECFEEVVRPRLKDDNVIARNFYMKPQRLPVATCQLYSSRMRDIFNKACRWNDPKYLESKVIERQQVEADIHNKLQRVTNSGKTDDWIDEEVDKLVQEWKKWE